MDDTTHVKKITLEKMKVGLQKVVSSALLNDMEYNIASNVISDSFVHQLSLYLMSNKVHTEERDVAIKFYPTTMWEELKKDFCPNWLKRRFPVRYSRDITHQIHNHYHICPHLNIKDDREHLDFIIYDDVDSP